MRIETLWKYNETGRHYHTLQHICNMMDIAKAYDLKLTLAQKIAIAHHDTVYCFGKTGNEEMSAVSMYLEEKGNYSEKVLNTAYKIILSTARHEPQCKEANDVIDLDLFGLSNNPGYWSTLEKVRNEYSNHISQEQWNKGRAEWLNHMLDKKQIYHGFWKGSKHDKFAKTLMRSELDRMKDLRGAPLLLLMW
jgi:predicted metal-dependent HD superfamily phosphohydrolase